MIFKNKLDRIKMSEIQQRLDRIAVEMEEFEMLGGSPIGKSWEDIEREKSLVLSESFVYTRNINAFNAITRGLSDLLQ
jgi:hypothetical protein